jgi:truncated hemoglobin YjbI
LAEALEVAMETLYDRLGGTDAITAVVDDFVARCAADDHGERLTVARGHEHARSSNHDGHLGRVLTSSPGSR